MYGVHEDDVWGVLGMMRFREFRVRNAGVGSEWSEIVQAWAEMVAKNARRWWGTGVQIVREDGEGVWRILEASEEGVVAESGAESTVGFEGGVQIVEGTVGEWREEDGMGERMESGEPELSTVAESGTALENGIGATASLVAPSEDNTDPLPTFNPNVKSLVQSDDREASFDELDRISYGEDDGSPHPMSNRANSRDNHSFTPEAYTYHYSPHLRPSPKFYPPSHDDRPYPPRRRPNYNHSPRHRPAPYPSRRPPHTPRYRNPSTKCPSPHFRVSPRRASDREDPTNLFTPRYRAPFSPRFPIRHVGATGFGRGDSYRPRSVEREETYDGEGNVTFREFMERYGGRRNVRIVRRE